MGSIGKSESIIEVNARTLVLDFGVLGRAGSPATALDRGTRLQDYQVIMALGTDDLMLGDPHRARRTLGDKLQFQASNSDAHSFT